MLCSASVSDAEGLEPIEMEVTEARLEGQAAHWLAALALRGDGGSGVLDGIGETAPNGIVIDEIMARHVAGYVELVRRHGHVVAERDVVLFGGQGAHVTGRPDGVVTDDQDFLRVYELKYGYKVVEPQAYPQLLLGALAFVDWDRHRMISLEVFQPRAPHPSGPHRKWVIDIDELRRWERWLHSRALDALNPNPTATPGEVCARCPRRAGCHALRADIFAAAASLESNRPLRPLTAHELGLELLLLERLSKGLEARLAGSRAEALARARREFIPGYEIRVDYGDREWTEFATPEVVRMMTGIEPYKQVRKSPAEIEKEGGNVAPFTDRTRRKATLKRFSPKLAERAFRS